MTKSLIDLTRTVAPKASMLGVRMTSGHFHAPEIVSEKSVIEFSISPTYEPRDSDGEYLCTICFKLRAVADSEDRKETGLQVFAEFEVPISIAGDHEEEAIDAFIRLNSVFVTWPYLREFVQSSTSRMQVPPLFLPLMTANAIANHLSQGEVRGCLLYTSPSPRDQRGSRMQSSA